MSRKIYRGMWPDPPIQGASEPSRRVEHRRTVARKRRARIAARVAAKKEAL